MFKKIVLITLLVDGCNNVHTYPDMGDISYQHATVCAPIKHISSLQKAVDTWKNADNRINIHIQDENITDPDNCDINIVEGSMGSGKDGGSGPGMMIITPISDKESEADRNVVLTHEFGHFLIGHRYGGNDPSHNPDPNSVMYWASKTDHILPSDLVLIPSQ